MGGPSSSWSAWSAWRNVVPASDCDDDALDAELSAMVVRAKGRAPSGIRENDDAFAAFVSERAAKSDTPAAFFRSPQLADLYLAWACIEGDGAALRAFEARFAEEIRRASGRVATDAAEEIGQRVREKLFVQGKLAAYSGTGPLGAWLHAVVARTAIEWLRVVSHRPLASSDDALDRLVDPHDPELAQLRAEYMEPFKRAFQDALASLTPRERTLLRLSVIDRLTADQIARAEGAHRVTVARWLGAIRDKLLDTTRAILVDRLGLTSSEFGKVTRFCLSLIDVSLHRVLRDFSDEEEGEKGEKKN